MQQQREQIRKALPEIVDRLIQQAVEGDTAAAKLLLERSVPALRPLDMPVQVPLTGSDLAESGRAVLSAVGEGRLTPDQGSRILAAIAALGRVTGATELAERIEALEAAITGKSPTAGSRPSTTSTTTTETDTR
jgi:hypothetical protein